VQWASLPASSVRRASCVLAETLIIGGSLVLAVHARLGAEAADYRLLLPKALASALVFQLCLYYSGLYEDFATWNRIEMVRRPGQAFVLGTFTLALVYFCIPPLHVGRGILLLHLPLAFAGVLAWRSLCLLAYGHEALRETVLILGTGQIAQQIAREMLRRAPLGYRMVGFLGEHPSRVGLQVVDSSVVGTLADLLVVVREQRVTSIVVGLDDFRGFLPVTALLQCRLAGIGVEDATSAFERLAGRIPVKSLRQSWFVFSDGFRRPRRFPQAKRAIEFCLAVPALLVLSPLLALLALLIKLDSHGPVLHSQDRVGEQGRLFRLHKLRSMKIDAESTTGPVWATSGYDPRMTSLGRWLRRLRLDEIPQILNVLRGEMSFVGPRPERPHFVERLRQAIPFYEERHTVKPGITGWAQVKFGYGSNVEDAEAKLEFDLYYIKNMSLFLDLSIVFQTFKVMLLGRGAR
jgi:sugar transferase (PEP-CTERM system associated)